MISVGSLVRSLNLAGVKSLATVTQIADESVLRQASRVLIKRHHERVGGSSKLGVPTADIRPLERDGGKGMYAPYSSGGISLLFDRIGPDNPQAIVRHEAEVRFLGFRCHEEADHDQSTGADEPYFIINVQGINAEGRVTARFGPYGDVDSGEDRFEDVVLTNTVQPPFVISVVAMEHDQGSPDEAAAKVDRAFKDGAAVVAGALVFVGLPEVAVVLLAVSQIFGGIVGDAGSAIFGLGDDEIGANQVRVFDYDPQKDKWLTPKPISDTPFGNKRFNLVLPIHGGEEGTYTLVFDVQLFEVTKKLVPTES